MPPPNDKIIRKRTPEDFVFGKVIGEGSFSTVYLAKEVHTSREFAIKVLEKRHIIREKKTEYVNREKKVLQILGSFCKYFVHLYYTFQDIDRLYFVLTYAKNGELLQQINKDTGFSLECTKYYAAELALGLEYLNFKGIVHRDLKPENVLFDENWHILITDFGSAKILGECKLSNEENQKRRRKYSFVGTAQYVSPEILNDAESSCASDLWAFGCIIYQMLTGQMPFRGGSEYLIFQKILKLDYDFPQGFDKIAEDLIEKCLVITPSSRLGATDQVPYRSIREHDFFKNVNWDNLGPPPKNFTKSDKESDVTIIPDDLEPGLNEERASRLHFEMLSPQTPPRKKSEPNRKMTDLNDEEIKQRLELQKSNIYHELVEGNLILKQGVIEKKKGIFPRRRMLLLTLGPHLYYVDPVTMILKGEIPWSEDLKSEARNFKKFFIHTPNRIYYLEDPEGYALEWCKAIDEVKAHYYPVQQSDTL